jgi:hypothetical protein
MFHLPRPRWLSTFFIQAEHLGYQGELELVAFLFAATVMLGAYFLAVYLLLIDVL